MTYEEFMEALRATPRNWYIDLRGAIRSQNYREVPTSWWRKHTLGPKHEFDGVRCPIEAVSGCENWGKGATKLEFAYDLSALVVIAADCPSASAYFAAFTPEVFAEAEKIRPGYLEYITVELPRVRKDLLEACGLA